MDHTRVGVLLELQAGVVSRSQILTADGTPSDIERMLRRRDLVRLLPGVYLSHTGRPTWLERAWAGVLFHWPSALAGRAALRAATGAEWRRHADETPIEIAVPQTRHVIPRPGYHISRPSNFDGRVLWNAAPPRIRIEEAGLDVASAAATQIELIATLADLCQSRRTTAGRLQASLAGRGRIRQRDVLAAVLADIADGTCSVLEHGYLVHVERAHALPIGRRQALAAVRERPSQRDVEYDVGLVVELDGRLFHDSAHQRDLDLDRDLVVAVEGKGAVRLGWGQVFARSCWTAARITDLLHVRGWTGRPVPCSPGCDLAG